jgi:predicted Na+-dependent transporter
VKTKRVLGLFLAGAGIIDIVIAASILDSMPRTVVLASGVTTIGLGLFFFVAGLRSGPN